MPLYDYKCDGCGHAVSDVFRKMTTDTPEPCLRCSTAMRKVPTLPHTDLKEFHTPIEMYSIAVNTPEEVRAFKQRCPDVDMAEDENDPMFGIPIARNRKQKLAALNVAGFNERN